MGSSRKLQWTDADVRCPFYITHAGSARSITCEGHSEGTELVSRFQTLRLQDRHMGICCAGRYEDCPVYRCVNQYRYGDE